MGVVCVSRTRAPVTGVVTLRIASGRRSTSSFAIFFILSGPSPAREVRSGDSAFRPPQLRERPRTPRARLQQPNRSPQSGSPRRSAKTHRLLRARAASGQAKADPAMTLMEITSSHCRPKAQDCVDLAYNYSRDLRSAKWGSAGKLHGSNSEPLRSDNGMVRPCSCPASDKLARGTQTRSTQCPEQQHRMRSP